MKTQTEPETMQNESPEPEFAGTATYCPEDNKIRLYVGRVPRDEYLNLKAEGWTSTAKQTCDFVAVWTPERRDTALGYAGIIEDEDASPADRAADRAERFSGYRDKRMGEATGHADRYDSGPRVHGFQDYGRAVRAADRHDRIAGHAVDSWDKAEYWQRRTAGVIANALYRSEPSVRMGRIKELESDLRRIESNYTPQDESAIVQADRYSKVPEPEQVRHRWCGLGRGGHWVPEHRLDSIKAGYASWVNHIKGRLLYENAMLEAAGGRAGVMEIEVAGFFHGAQIYKVNKSTVTGRVTSVAVRAPRVSGWTYKVENVPGTDYALALFDTEREPPSAYRAPTDEEREAFKKARKAEKAAKPKAETIPLINPTNEDAQRLQDVINERAKAEHDARPGAKYARPFEPKKIGYTTQANYSAISQGEYAKAQVKSIFGGGVVEVNSETIYARRNGVDPRGPALCKIRIYGYDPVSVLVLTDKPQKPLPASVWQAFQAAPVEPVTA